MKFITVAVDASKVENNQPMIIKELSDLELTAIGGGCAESTPY